MDDFIGEFLCIDDCCVGLRNYYGWYVCVNLKLLMFGVLFGIVYVDGYGRWFG